MAFPFSPFTHILKIRPPDSRRTFSIGSLFQKIKELKKSREAAPRVRELRLTEQSKVEAGVVYCFKPSVPNNLCKQGSPIPTWGAIMPLFAEAVAPHCPHQWGWWIDVWVWYLIKPPQLHNRGTCLASKDALTQACTLHTKITTGLINSHLALAWYSTMNYCGQATPFNVWNNSSIVWENVCWRGIPWKHECL